MSAVSELLPNTTLAAARKRIAIPVSGGDVTETVREIIDEVRRDGDKALIRLTARFDKVRLNSVKQPATRAKVSAQLTKDMEMAYERILRYHTEYADRSRVTPDGAGGLWGRMVRPLRRIGIYVPGGTAPLFSTVLMAVAAARAAGVKEIVVASPPPIHPTILAAARLTGVTELYRVGGAQAIAALAHGTKTIRPVEKIVGPGNKFVTEAKRQVFGTVGIDGLAGPTEILILADETANPEIVAADLIAQAEHDVIARPVLASTSTKLISETRRILTRRLSDLPRREVAETSLRNEGMAIKCKNEIEMIELANFMAAEHLEILTVDPWKIAEQVEAAGAIFVGPDSPEVLGDYVAGPNHVLPTARTARFSAPLSARDFVAVSSVQSFSPEARRRLSGAAARMARAEELEGHARSIESRDRSRPGKKKKRRS